MQDTLEYKHADYRSIPHEEWYDLLSTMEVKDNVPYRYVCNLQGSAC